MARFTQDVQKSNDPDYTKMSRGWDAGKVDNSAGTLLTNIGENAGLLVGALDQGVKKEIESAVYEGVDKRRAEQGVDVATAWQGQAFRPEVGPLPEKELSTPAGGKRDANAPTVSTNPMVANYNRSIADLTSAYNQGTISDSFYFSRLEAMSRGLRARFPGYRAEVDAMVQNVAGINPANALRRSLLGQMQEAEVNRQKAVEKAENWENKNAQWIYQLFPDFGSNRAKYAGRMEEVKSAVYNLQAKEAQMSREKAEIELADKQGAQVEDRALSHAMATVNTRAAIELTAANNAAQAFQQTIMTKLGAAQGITPEEEAQITQGLNALRTQRQIWVDNYLRDPARGINGKSLIETIKDQKKLEQIRSEATRDIDTMITAVTNKDIGLIGLVGRLNSASLDQANAAINKRSPSAVIIQALGRNPGMATVLGAIINNPEFNSKMVQDLTSLIFGGAATGVTGGLTEDMKSLIEAQRSGRMPPKAASTIISSLPSILTNPQSTEEARRNVINYLYSNKELQVLDLFGTGKGKDGTTTRTTMFSRLANKAVTDTIVKQFGIDSPEFQTYDRWVKNNFIALNQVNINTLKDRVEDSAYSRYYNLIWDEGRKVFIPDLTPEGVKWFQDVRTGKIPGSNMLVGEGGVPNFDLMMGKSADALRDFNKSLSTYGSVLDAKKLNAGVEIAQMLRYNGFDISGQKPEQRGFFQKMYDSLVGSDKNLSTDPTMEGAEEKYKSKVTPKSTPDKRSELNVDETQKYAGVLPDGHREVLEAITPEESGGNYNRLVFGDGTTPKEANLTSMTVAEVLDYQSGMRGRGHASSAAGKYQIIRGTLQSLVDQGVLDPSDMFDEANQDKAAMALLERRGYSQWKSGKMSYDQFISGLKDEWEAVKKFPKTFNRVYAVLDKQAKGE